MYLWIHDKYSSTRFKQCEWQRKILQGNQFLIRNCAVVAWPSGMRSRFLHWRKLVSGSYTGGLLPMFFFFLFPSYFYPLACLCLFSLLLASRDFCDNVFLNILVTILLVFTPIQLSRFKSKVTKGPMSTPSRATRSLTRGIISQIVLFFIFLGSFYWYSWLPITRTLANTSLALTQTKIDFPWISFIHLL